jgi:hypothetical protein
MRGSLISHATAIRALRYGRVLKKTFGSLPIDLDPEGQRPYELSGLFGKFSTTEMQCFEAWKKTVGNGAVVAPASFDFPRLAGEKIAVRPSGG